MTLPGVTFLDHTADVGMDVEADSLEELLHRSALGMLALLRGEEEQPAGRAETRASPSEGVEAGPELDLETKSGPELMRQWLRELLLLHEVEHRDYTGFTSRLLEPWALRCVVRVRPGGHAVREIKGVTYHDLQVERRGDRWHARVIFDV